MNTKLILTDVDGVLLSWDYAFDQYMRRTVSSSSAIISHDSHTIGEKYGLDPEVGDYLVRIFNQSATMGFLAPYLDAIKYVKRLHEEHGYIFHAITSMGLDLHAQKLRVMNLENLFGKNVFEDVIFLDTGEEKSSVLKEYAGSDCYWIEDNFANCLTGLEYGLKPILLNHSYNRKYEHDEVTRVTSWKDIYHIITGM